MFAPAVSFAPAVGWAIVIGALPRFSGATFDFITVLGAQAHSAALIVVRFLPSVDVV